MKRKHIFLPILAALSLSGCSLSDFFGNSNTSTDENNVTVDQSLQTTDDSAVEHAGNPYEYNEEINVDTPEEITITETEEEFSISAKNDIGAFTQEGNIITITAAGSYNLSGKFEGQILVNAGDEDEVELNLSGVSISYDLDSPIKVVNADKVEISAKSGTGNIIKDLRAHKVEDVEEQFEGAIAAKTDMKLKGTGTLVVEGNYNNGVHTTKDLTIQKLTLKVTGYNNAIKGKNSVTITSGTVQAYAQTGNGIKTENTDVSSKGKQRGNITINGGSIYVDSLHDGLDASYNVEVHELDETVPTVLVVKCGKNSTVYSSSAFTADSEKGLKAQNNVVISAGTISIAASDDAIHANYGDPLDNGSSGEGNITVSGGLIKIASGDDGLHADNVLTIDDGKIYVTGSTEGLEANYITINGGSTYVYGSDDGVNCSAKSTGIPSFVMNGGYLDVAVNNGDTDGIDSNGTVTIAGGVIVTRGAPGTGSNMATGLDVDKSCTMTGGTLVAFNGLEKSPTISSGVSFAGTSGSNSSNGMGGPGGPGGWKAGHGGPGGGGQQPGGSSTSSYNFQAGQYTLSGTDIELSFINDFSYTKFCIYSAALVSGATYTLSRGETSVVSWTQSSSSVTIS